MLVVLSKKSISTNVWVASWTSWCSFQLTSFLCGRLLDKWWVFQWVSDRHFLGNVQGMAVTSRCLTAFIVSDLARALKLQWGFWKMCISYYEFHSGPIFQNFSCWHFVICWHQVMKSINIWKLWTGSKYFPVFVLGRPCFFGSSFREHTEVGSVFISWLLTWEMVRQKAKNHNCLEPNRLPKPGVLFMKQVSQMKVLRRAEERKLMFCFLARSWQNFLNLRWNLLKRS